MNTHRHGEQLDARVDRQPSAEVKSLWTLSSARRGRRSFPPRRSVRQMTGLPFLRNGYLHPMAISRPEP